MVKPAEVDGFVAVAVEACVHGPQSSERQLVPIQPFSTYDTDSGAIVGMTRGVQRWEPGTLLYCKVANTGRATAVVCGGHPTSVDPTAKPPAETPPVHSADTEHASPRGVDVADGNIGLLNRDQKQRLHHVLRPKDVVGLFPEDTKAVRACTVRELQIPLIDEDTPPIAVMQQLFSPEQVDAV